MRVGRGVILLLLWLSAPALVAAESRIEVSEPWARASAGARPNGAVYLRLIQRGTRADRLLGASTSVARAVEIHESLMRGGMMRMRPVASLALVPGEVVTLRPRGWHLMLRGLTQPLREGQRLRLRLEFQHAPARDVEVPILGVGAMGPNGKAVGERP